MINRRKSFSNRSRDNYEEEKDFVTPILVAKRTTYDDLYDMVPKTIDKVSNLNLYFDLRSQVSSFFSPKFQNFSEILARGKETIFCTEILNTLAHYRAFFWKEYGISTNLILYYSLTAPQKQKEIYPDYMSEYLERHHSSDIESAQLERLLENNLKLMREVIIKLPNVYLIDTKNSDPAALPYYLTSQDLLKNDFYNIVFSNQPYMLSYCAYPKFAIMTMKSKKSTFITKHNIFYVVTEDNKSVKNFLESSECKIHSSFYIHDLAICGEKKLSLPGWNRYGIVSTLNKFIKSHEKGLIDLSIEYSLNGIVEFLSEKADSSWKMTQEKIDSYVRNYRLLDYSKESSDYTSSSIVSINDQIAQKRIDLDAVYEANHRYFQRNPINIKSFMCGEH